MKLTGIFAVSCAAVIIISSTPSAFAGSARGTASVEIRQPVAVSQQSGLDFGVLSVDQADVITLSPAGDVTTQNGANIVSGSTSPASFQVAGTAGSAISISFTDGTLSGAGQPMQVNNFTHDAGAGVQLDETGSLTFAVGADLSINDGQAPGQYDGTYQVSVNYQ